MSRKDDKTLVGLGSSPKSSAKAVRRPEPDRMERTQFGLGPAAKAPVASELTARLARGEVRVVPDPWGFRVERTSAPIVVGDMKIVRRADDRFVVLLPGATDGPAFRTEKAARAWCQSARRLERAKSSSGESS